MKYFSYELTMMKASVLKSGQAYQRPINAKRIKQIRDSFSWNLVNPIKVSERDGVYYVFDGQHTLTVIKSNFEDDVIVPVMLYHGLTYEKEAELAARSDENRRTMARHEIDNAMTEAGEKEHQEFIKVCNEFGWNVDFNQPLTRRDYYVQYPSTVFNAAYKKHGVSFLKQFLNVFDKCWNGEYDSMHNNLEKGVIKFMEAFEDEYDSKILIRALSGVDTSIIYSNCKRDTLRTGIKAYAHYVWHLYNKASKGKKLPELF